MFKWLFFLALPCFCWAQHATVVQVQQLIHDRSFKKAEQLIAVFLNEDPNNLQAIELYGDSLGHQEKWDEAMEVYKKLVSQQPNNANYHYKYGGSLAKKILSVSKLKALNYVGDAKEAFLKAAELDPKHIDTRWALVEIYLQLPGILGGSNKRALSYANELQSISKVDGYMAKGYFYEYTEEPELAEKYYKMSVNVGGSLVCYDKLSKFYQQQNNPEQAIATIQTSLDKHQRNSLHYQLGRVCAEYNLHLDKGEECLKTYIEKHTARDGVPIAWANFRLAQIYRHKKDKNTALAYIQLAIKELPEVTYFEEEKQKIKAL